MDENKKNIPANVIKLLKVFQKLSLDDKKKKLLNVIEAIGYETESITLVKDAILNNPFTNNEFLDGVYTDIMAFADAIQQGDKSKAMQSLQDTQSYIIKLREREELERQIEEGELEIMIQNI